jgi:hypothetical protein
MVFWLFFPYFKYCDLFVDRCNLSFDYYVCRTLRHFATELLFRDPNVDLGKVFLRTF